MYQALEIARTTHVTYIMEPAWNAILDGLDHFAQIVRSKQYSNYDHMMIKRFFLKLANHSNKVYLDDYFLCYFRSEECVDGKYGQNCLNTCTSHCKYNNVCNHLTGQCEGGCDGGWTGSFCEKGNLERNFKSC